MNGRTLVTWYVCRGTRDDRREDGQVESAKAVREAEVPTAAVGFNQWKTSPRFFSSLLRDSDDPPQPLAKTGHQPHIRVSWLNGTVSCRFLPLRHGNVM
ncbi:hypothetical protein CIB48_g1086 [Xylaria polymorpha]|nr:hypothetical protein CIB48_g1086 [Xylaria polymorpha]